MSSERIDLLSTRRPTRVDELYKAVPKPAGGVPKHGLPIWSDLLLDAKLPVIKAPKGALVFSRGKVGEKLWRRPATQDFNLYDPNGYEVMYHYDALHDGNLRRLLAQEGLQRRLKELGLMTDNGEAVCSLKQLNEYRRYLKRLHLDSLNQERQHRDELERERQILENAQRYADKERMMLDKNSLRKEKMDNNRAKLEEEKLEKEHMLASRRRRHAQRIKQIARRKLEDALRRRERSLALDQKVLSRVLMANEIERRRKIHMMRRWHDGETRRLRLREQRRRQELRDRECREAERWQQKLEEQLDYKKRREELLIKHEQQMEFLVDLRNHVVNQQRLQLELALQDIKHRRNKQNRDKNDRQRSTAMLNAMSKVWDDHCNNVREVSKPDVKNALASTMNIMKHKGQDVLDILQAAKEKLERDVSVPEGVSVAIDELLNGVIRLHIRCKMYSMLNEVALKLLQTLDSERNSLTGEEHRWPHWIVRHVKSSTVQECKPLRTPKIRYSFGESGQFQSQRSSVGKLKSRITSGTGDISHTVSFGVVNTIENIEVDTPLTSVKDRPPTPVPSLTELVKAIFEDPVLTTEEEVMQDFIHERTKIKKTLCKMAKHLYRAIICMPDHILDANKRKFIRRQFSLSSQREDDLDEVVHRLTDAMLSHEDDELMNNEAMHFAIDFLFKDFMQQTYFPENKSREFSKSGREKSKSVTIFPPSHKEK